jgi:hypothetical protein
VAVVTLQKSSTPARFAEAIAMVSPSSAYPNLRNFAPTARFSHCDNWLVIGPSLPVAPFTGAGTRTRADELIYGFLCVVTLELYSQGLARTV